MKRISPVFDIIAIGSSRGGFSALRHIIGQLPPDFPAAIVVAQHLSATHQTVMPELLQRRTKLRVVQAREGARLWPGTMTIAPPDRHLKVRGNSVELDRGPLRNMARPSADVLFESVAESFGPRGIGVVLTGMGKDGAQGAVRIRAAGGRVLVQEPGTAELPDMPNAAIAAGGVDLVLPLDVISKALVAMVSVLGTADLFDVPPPPWVSFS